ncbi:hypothetical protein DFJ73DRAFT_758573 [Zopfochytrium polystomum]|nr:hypothetical protein DFJ73DRAFT_758573 [Zopfochytrium polystomum]
MAKAKKKGKGKAKGKGKGGKSKKSKKSSRARGPVGKPLPQEQATALLSYLSKDLLRRQRIRLHCIEKAVFEEIQQLLDNDDAVTEKIVQLAQQKGNEAALEALAAAKNDTLSKQWEEMLCTKVLEFTWTLQERIDNLEDELEKCQIRTLQLQELELYGTAALDEELARTKLIAEQRAIAREAEIAKIQQRHESSVRATHKRADKILADLEARANQKEIDGLEESQLAIVARNRRLHAQVEGLSRERDRIARIVEQLERENMEAVATDYDVEWNLRPHVLEEDASMSGTTVLSSSSLPVLPPIIASAKLVGRTEIEDIQQTVELLLQKEYSDRQKMAEDFGVIGQRKEWGRGKRAVPAVQ